MKRWQQWFAGCFCLLFLIVAIGKYYKVIPKQTALLDSPQVEWDICETSLPSNHIFENDTVHIVTPTYKRPEQLAELTRLTQTLLSVRNFHWIIAEDSHNCSMVISKLLHRNKIKQFTLIKSPMPAIYKSQHSQTLYGLPRGVAGRNAAVEWLLQHTSAKSKNILYFADDDNSYDLRLFEDIRRVKLVGMMPVGLVQPAGVSSPIVNWTGIITGFVSQPFNRRFFIDMAGFATSISLVHATQPKMPYKATWEEEGFLHSLNIKYNDILPLAKNCTEIYVWHTMTFAPKVKMATVPKWKSFSNLRRLYLNMQDSGVIEIQP